MWRLLRDEGTPLGLSTVYRVIAAVRPTLPVDLMVRFEGVAGEFAQFDFGEVAVRVAGGAKRVVHFAAYRLKYSRWVYVVVVPNGVPHWFKEVNAPFTYYVVKVRSPY